MTQQFTHTAKVKGRLFPSGATWLLRQTEKFWISKRGFKFRKTDGTEAGVTRPVFTLILDTLKVV